jgi:hypothetical protein
VGFIFEILIELVGTLIGLFLFYFVIKNKVIPFSDNRDKWVYWNKQPYTYLVGVIFIIFFLFINIYALIVNLI